MSGESEASKLERSGQPVAAIAAYRELLATGEASLEERLCFAVLLWMTTDFGFSSFHKIPDEVVRDAYDEALGVLDQAEEKFGAHNEIDFWRDYFAFITLGKEARPERAVEQLRRGPSKVPALHAFGQLGAAYAEDARALLAECSPPTTERERYVVSVLESSFNIWGMAPGGGADRAG